MTYITKVRHLRLLFWNLTLIFVSLLLLQMEVDSSKGEGFRSYYITKIEELQLVVAEKSQNLRRLQAQRNELNAKGMFINYMKVIYFEVMFLCNSSNVKRRIAIITRTRELRWGGSKTYG